MSSLVDWTKLPNAADGLKWHQNAGLVKLFFFTSILYVGQYLNGYDGTVVSNLQGLSRWNADLGNPDSSKIGLLNAAAYIVGICMGPVNAIVIDKFGRKWPIRWFGISMILGTLLGCVAGIVQGNQGYGLFVASRAISGSGITMFLMTAQIMMQEIPHPRYRAVMAGFWDTNWVLGATTASWVSFGSSFINSSWSWRTPYIIQLLPAFYMLIAVQFVPETPRYLMAKGRYEEAHDFLIKYHGNGDPDDELVAYEWAEMQATFAAEQERQQYTWSELLAKPGNKHRLFLAMWMTFMPQMNGSSIINFYYTVVLKLNGITAATQLTGIGAGLNMYAFFLQCAGSVSMKYFRRRTMVLTIWPMLAVGLAAMAIATAQFQNSGKTNHAAGIASVVMVWVYSTPVKYIAPLFYAYPAEVLDYTLRAKGMALWNTVNQATGAYGAYVNSIALNSIGYKYYFVYIALVIIQWIGAYFYMVETKGLTLEEVAVAFEGEAAAVNQAVERLENHEKEKDAADVVVA